MNNFEWTCAEIAAFLAQNQFGEIVVTVQSGKVAVIKTSKTSKPPLDE